MADPGAQRCQNLVAYLAASLAEELPECAWTVTCIEQTTGFARLLATRAYQGGGLGVMIDISPASWHNDDNATWVEWLAGNVVRSLALDLAAMN